MKRTLLRLLSCPECGGEIVLQREDGLEEIQEGELACATCGKSWPIKGGIPRFGTLKKEYKGTVDRFGWEWQTFTNQEEDAYLREQFWAWMNPIKPGDVQGKLVLEGGCGGGRHTLYMLEAGVGEIVAVDLSDSVEVAHRRVSSYPNAHVIQADIFHLPLKTVFDMAFSIGVVHHTPDPMQATFSLASWVRPNGQLLIWVYGYENNWWIHFFVTPLRKYIFSNLPNWLTYAISWLLTIPLFILTRGIYYPLRKSWLGRRLPYASYLIHITPLTFRSQHAIVHDHITVTTASYHKREEVEGWAQSLGLRPYQVRWHNKNSWTLFGTLPAFKHEAVSLPHGEKER